MNTNLIIKTVAVSAVGMSIIGSFGLIVANYKMHVRKDEQIDTLLKVTKSHVYEIDALKKVTKSHIYEIEDLKERLDKLENA